MATNQTMIPVSIQLRDKLKKQCKQKGFTYDGFISYIYNLYILQEDESCQL